MRLRNLAINLGAIALSAAISLSLQFPKLNQRISGQTLEETRKAVRDEEARLKLIRQLPSRGLGFNNMMANFTFLQFLQYFGDDISRNYFQTGYSLSPRYFENIIDRDPRFLSSYIYLSSSVSMFAGVPREADDIYAKGLRSLDPDKQPTASIVWRYKATDQLLFLGDAKGARESYLQAADWAERAKVTGKELEEAQLLAQVSRQSAKWLEEDRDLTKAQIAAWTIVLRNAADKKTVQIVAQELDKLGMKIEVQNGATVVVPKSSTQAN
jgi:tetratricopeptide (TPR) repeat protein